MRKSDLLPPLRSQEDLDAEERERGDRRVLLGTIFALLIAGLAFWVMLAAHLFF